MRYFFFYKLLICFILLVPFVGFAEGYKVTPRVMNYEVKQRDIFTETITVTNNTDHKLNLYAAVNEVNLDEGGDIVAFTPRSVADNTTTPTSWINFTRGRIELMPGKSKEVPIEFQVHPEAAAGVYYVFIGFGAAHNQPLAHKQVAEGSAPGVMVTLSVDQKQTEFLKLGQFVIDRFVTEPENNAITYKLNNPGSAELVPKGEIIFYDSRGTEVAAVPVNPDNQALAPGQESEYTMSAPTDNLFGKYKAFLSVDYGSQQLASVYDTAFFYVVPWQKLLLVFSGVMFIAILLTVLLHRRYSHDDDDDFYHDEHHNLPVFVRKDRKSVV